MSVWTWNVAWNTNQLLPYKNPTGLTNKVYGGEIFFLFEEPEVFDISHFPYLTIPLAEIPSFLPLTLLPKSEEAYRAWFPNGIAKNIFDRQERFRWSDGTQGLLLGFLWDYDNFTRVEKNYLFQVQAVTPKDKKKALYDDKIFYIIPSKVFDKSFSRILS